MPKQEPYETDVEEIPDGTDSAWLADASAELGRAVADRAREALTDAQNRVNGLSDLGVVAAAGFALGVTGSLLFAGGPRLIVACSAVPVALTVRSALGRGKRPTRLVN